MLIEKKLTEMSQFTLGQGNPLVQVRDIIKIYHTAAGDFPALKGLNFDVYPGELLGIIGKSGAGKSTLVNMLTAVDKITSGEIFIDGTAVQELDEDQAALWRGLNIGIVYQSFQLLPNLSLLDNVMLPMDFCGLYKPQKSKERAFELLRQVELQDHANKLPSAISGGQQQRVAIARALANDPPLIIADEPTGNLDSVTADTIFTLFEHLVQQGKTIILVSHDRNLSERTTRLLAIEDGFLIHPCNN